MTDPTPRARCGNDPRAHWTPGDRQAVEAFRAYLADRAALRDRIVEALLTTRRTDYADLNVKDDHRNHRYDARCALCAYDVDALASAVLAVLPPIVDQAALLTEVADRLDTERARRVKAAWSPDEATAAREWGTAASFVRSLIPQPPTPDGVVAYSPGGRTLRCTRCRPNPLGSEWQALTAEDLEHGGICTACGTDVLIREQP
ncbi:hypothetical protein [Streptomyces longwoodensis]|uniref:hypothetical protein n=1 Tax=Streptomyces longwoodensis TaxID=68231 RepID=UPI0036E492C8